MARPSRRPLAVAALLVAAAALLMALVDAERPRAAPRQLEFPRFPRQAERQRIVARRTLPPAAPAQAAAGDEPEATPPPRDPFLLALPADAAKPLLVLEANALRHSRLGELFVECLVRESGQDPFEEVRRDAGIDPLRDIDRVALAGDGVVLYGFFGGARLEGLERGWRAIRYGDEGRIFAERASAAGSGGREDRSPVVGAWRDQLLAFGERTFVEATIDRLEGRAPPNEPILPEYLTYGEAYGVLPGDGLRSLFHGELSGLGTRLAEVASRIELHADAMRDVTVVARVSGKDEAAVEDLGTAFGAALSVGRVQARLRGDEELSELLEHARVVRGGQRGFSLELALPVNVLERWFEGCGRSQATPRSE